MITGSNGFIGRNLIRKLIFENYQVIGIDNGFTSEINNFENSKNYTFKNKDIFEINENDLKGVKTLIHLAAVKKHSAIDSTGESELFRTNFIATSRLFSLAKKNNVKKIIFASSLYAHGDMHNINARENDNPVPLTLYGQSKLFGEHQLKALSIDNSIKTVALRLYFIYGPEQFYGKGYPSVFISSCNNLNKGLSPKINNNGNQKLDYLYVDDLIELIKKIIIKDPENSFEIINASSGNAYTINDIINLITKTWNKIYGTDICPEYSNVNDFTYETFRAGNNKKAHEIYYWSPKVTIENGIKNFIEWYINAYRK